MLARNLKIKLCCDSVRLAFVVFLGLGFFWGVGFVVLRGGGGGREGDVCGFVCLVFFLNLLV